MSFQDKSIQCHDCGATFTFSAGEQEQFASRGYTNEPKRCPSCRQERKHGSTETVATAMAVTATGPYAKCSPRDAPSVVKTPKYPLNLAVVDRCIVAIATVKSK